MSVPRSPIQIGSTRWIVTLATMTAVIVLSIDMSLPAQPTLAATFDVEDATAGLTLSVFVVGFAFAQLLVGYLSDAWGRRRVLLGGLALGTPDRRYRLGGDRIPHHDLWCSRGLWDHQARWERSAGVRRGRGGDGRGGCKPCGHCGVGAQSSSLITVLSR